VADYFILRKTRLDVDGLYRHQGPYTYSGGWNRAALVALVVAVAPNIPGFLHAAGALPSVPAFFDDVYTYAWFVGFLFAGALYLGLMRVMYPASGPATAEAQASAPEAS
jgi:NCS1 family nucleobase:cation symporter-1